MQDAHIHFESQPYTLAGLQLFIDEAIKQGLNSIMILEHTHRFIEWDPLYDQMLGIDQAQDDWFLKKQRISIKVYQDFITKMRQCSFSIHVAFGLEVCYFHEKEEFIKTMLASFPYDFAVGSVHYVDHIAYDLEAFSKRILWDVMPTNTIYQHYYQEMMLLINSDLFQGVAHPDTIKLFHRYPTYDLTDTYHKIAELLKQHKMYTENNVGCFYRYHHEDLGLHDTFLSILKEHQVEIRTASDAHIPKDVGKFIKEAKKRIDKKD